MALKSILRTRAGPWLASSWLACKQTSRNRCARGRGRGTGSRSGPFREGGQNERSELSCEYNGGREGERARGRTGRSSRELKTLQLCLLPVLGSARPREKERPSYLALPSAKTSSPHAPEGGQTRPHLPDANLALVLTATPLPKKARKREREGLVWLNLGFQNVWTRNRDVETKTSRRCFFSPSPADASKFTSSKLRYNSNFLLLNSTIH